jgi:hypothetical protein
MQRCGQFVGVMNDIRILLANLKVGTGAIQSFVFAKRQSDMMHIFYISWTNSAKSPASINITTRRTSLWLLDASITIDKYYSAYGGFIEGVSMLSVCVHHTKYHKTPIYLYVSS